MQLLNCKYLWYLHIDKHKQDLREGSSEKYMHRGGRCITESIYVCIYINQDNFHNHIS